MPKVLLVDDEEKLLKSLSIGLESMGYEVITAQSGAAALAAVDGSLPDMLITDLVMPGMDGISLMKEIKEKSDGLPVIIMTGHGTVETAVRAMKEGAFDYITKPFNLDEVEVILKRALEHTRLVAENRALKKQIKKKFAFSSIIGMADAMQEVYSIMERIKDTPSNVLITGESGTGKELIARALHYNGALKDCPFVTVDCASLTDNLLESELFGHVKGAFTGAFKDKIGYFEAADGGTIFLDEIGEFSPHLQTRLLRVLQEGEFSRVGDHKICKVDVRVIAATNRDIEEAAERGEFREDLFYRLNVINIKVPPLRDRVEDIPDLTTFFISNFNEKLGKNIKGLSEEALAVLAEYNWPGNVRQLENLVERMVIFCDEHIIGVQHLPEPLKSFTSTGMPENTFKGLAGKKYKEAKEFVIRKFNQQYLGELLDDCEGNISEASRRSGMDRGCLYRLIKKHEVEIEQE